MNKLQSRDQETKIKRFLILYLLNLTLLQTLHCIPRLYLTQFVLLSMSLTHEFTAYILTFMTLHPRSVNLVSSQRREDKKCPFPPIQTNRNLKKSIEKFQLFCSSERALLNLQLTFSAISETLVY